MINAVPAAVYYLFIQLFGSEPDFMAEAVKIVLEYNPDIIDINFKKEIIE